MTELSKELDDEIKEAKASGHVVRKVILSGKPYIYRSISRKEFRKIQDAAAERISGDELSVKQQQKMREDTEDALVMAGLIDPPIRSELDLDTVTMAAGVVSQLSELIMEASGFGDKPEPEDL